MAKAHHNTIVPQTCGVGVSGIFRHNTSPGGNSIKEMTNIGGAGWHMASFTDEGQYAEAYREAYEDLKKWRIIYQSEVRINSRTKHPFFFCLYDTQAKLKKLNNAKYEYPF